MKLGTGDVHIIEKQLQGGVMMFAWISGIVENFLILILHVAGSDSFPKPLSGKEEKQYLTALRGNDREAAKQARDKLIEHNLRLVVHVMKKYYAASVDQSDLISIGTIGLIKAIDTFDPEKGIRLSSYAARCVENEILMYFRSIRKNAAGISMNEPIDTDKDGNALTLQDTIASESNIAEDLEKKIKLEQAAKVIQTELPEREKQILLLRYGLIPGTKPLAQREVAKQIGISRSYVSRIEKKALQYLRKRLETETK